MKVRSLLAALGCLWGCSCAHWFVEPLPPEAQLDRARTGDGWDIALVRYPAQGAPTGRPVLLCHGITANARNMDLDRDHSLARWLAAHGREAWTMSLRGSGAFQGTPAAHRRGHFTFDTLWRQDLTAAIRTVRERSRAETIDFVGHSMGGLLVYAYLAEGGEGLNAVATLGSPTRLDWGGASDHLLALFAPVVLRKGALLPLSLLAQLAVPVQGTIGDHPFETLLYNPRNTTLATFQRLLAIGIGDLPAGVGSQMASMVSTGRFGSEDGRTDYRSDLARVHTPVLVVAGKADRVAIPPGVKDGYRALGGPKEWLLLGEENGVEADYGHMDLVLGDRAQTELWPRVLDFLDRHAR